MESWVDGAAVVDGVEVVDGDGLGVASVVWLPVVEGSVADVAGFVVGCCDLASLFSCAVPGCVFVAVGSSGLFFAVGHGVWVVLLVVFFVSRVSNVEGLRNGLYASSYVRACVSIRTHMGWHDGLACGGICGWHGSVMVSGT